MCKKITDSYQAAPPGGWWCSYAFHSALGPPPWMPGAQMRVGGEGAFSARFGLGVRMLLRACLLKEEKMCART
jgi:hypothetical protein